MKKWKDEKCRCRICKTHLPVEYGLHLNIRDVFQKLYQVKSHLRQVTQAYLEHNRVSEIRIFAILLIIFC